MSEKSRDEFKKIIIRMPNWVGDLVMATVILADVRDSFPNAQITAMCRYGICDLIEEDPNIDELFCFHKGLGAKRRDENKSCIQKIRQGDYDLGILLTNSFSSAWFFFQGRVKRRLGHRGNWRTALLTDPIKVPQNVKAQHLVTTYKMLLCPLGIEVSKTAPQIFLREEERKEAKALLAQHGISDTDKVIGIHPGASYGSAKCWLKEHFRWVAKELSNRGMRVVFFGGEEMISLSKEITSGLGSSVVNLAGHTSLRELAALIDRCDLLLANDSGPMHIASALGTKVVALFGSTNRVVTGPFSNGRVICKEVDCAPCHKRVCPIDFRCMKQIGADEVLRVIEEELG